MAERYCKLCGYRGGAGETQCPDCGAPLFEAPQGPPEKPAIEAEAVNITKKHRDRHLPRVALAAGFLAASLVLQSVGLWRAHRPEPAGWSYVNGLGQLVTPQGVWDVGGSRFGVLSAGAGPCKVLYAWDEMTYGGVPQGDVYFYDGETLEKTDWANAALSGDGQVLFYVAKAEGGEEVLTRRDLKTGRETELARGRGIGFAAGSDYAGTALAYYINGDLNGRQTSRLWQAASGSREVPEALWLLGKGGDNYLTYRVTDVNCWDTVMVWDGGERDTVLPGDLRVDRDLTELLYQDDEGWWHYENQAGQTRRLEELGRSCSLSSVRTSGFDYWMVGERLTDRAYVVSGGGLYYLGEDLSVTPLTSDGVVDTASCTANGQTIYYLFRPSGRAGLFLWQLERTASGDWEQSLALDSDNVQSFLLSRDGQTLCARCWEDKSYVWKLRTGDGTWQALPRADRSQIKYGGYAFRAAQALLPLDGGGCWYLGGDTSLHRELWYCAPDGESELKISYTSPVSSTYYPHEDSAKVILPFNFTNSDWSLIDLDCGDQALLEMRYPSPITPVSSQMSAWSDGATSDTCAEYWLLSADGEMTKLEAIEP